jgi:hypothetical protein
MAKRPQATDYTSVDRSTAGLRDMLFETLDDLRGERISHQKATAIVAVSSQIMNVTRTEIAFARFVNHDKMNGEEHGRHLIPLQLGSSRPTQP